MVNTNWKRIVIFLVPQNITFYINFLLSSLGQTGTFLKGIFPRSAIVIIYTSVRKATTNHE